MPSASHSVRSRVAALAVAAMAVAATAQAPAAAPATAAAITLEQVLAAPFASDLVASPDGRATAWVVNENGVRNVWAADAPAWTARRLTSYAIDEGQEIGDLAFAGGARPNVVLFVRGGDPNRGGEIPNPTSDASGSRQELFAVPLGGGEARRLAEGSGPVAAPGRRPRLLRPRRRGARRRARGRRRRRAALRGARTDGGAAAVCGRGAARVRQPAARPLDRRRLRPRCAGDPLARPRRRRRLGAGLHRRRPQCGLPASDRKGGAEPVRRAPRGRPVGDPRGRRRDGDWPAPLARPEGPRKRLPGARVTALALPGRRTRRLPVGARRLAAPLLRGPRRRRAGAADPGPVRGRARGGVRRTAHASSTRRTRATPIAATCGRWRPPAPRRSPSPAATAASGRPCPWPTGASSCCARTLAARRARPSSSRQACAISTRAASPASLPPTASSCRSR